MIQLFRVQSY